MECTVKVLSSSSIKDFLDAAGTVPIPPYFQRDAEESDKEAYNNVYAAQGGSVAAPTAGLHFTDAVLEKIGEQNCSFLSLHVGAGTFKPVVVDDARDHSMHAESFSVAVHQIQRIIAALKQFRDLTVVGTTSARTLESLFWCGVKRMRGLECDPKSLKLGQFEWVPLAVGEGRSATRIAALSALIEGLDESEYVTGSTSLMIIPGSYDFKVVDHLITNFHAPDSTLMLLVSAFIKDGKKIKSIYEDAQKTGFRFLSYGDACMFSRPGGRI
jgi:S-adenosylmethionine:tRNA ribosyltransferase-isomerase